MINIDNFNSLLSKQNKNVNDSTRPIQEWRKKGQNVFTLTNKVSSKNSFDRRENNTIQKSNNYL